LILPPEIPALLDLFSHGHGNQQHKSAPMQGKVRK